MYLDGHGTVASTGVAGTLHVMRTGYDISCGVHLDDDAFIAFLGTPSARRLRSFVSSTDLELRSFGDLWSIECAYFVDDLHQLNADLYVAAQGGTVDGIVEIRNVEYEYRTVTVFGCEAVLYGESSCPTGDIEMFVAAPAGPEHLQVTGQPITRYIEGRGTASGMGRCACGDYDDSTGTPICHGLAPEDVEDQFDFADAVAEGGEFVEAAALAALVEPVQATGSLAAFANLGRLLLTYPDHVADRWMTCLPEITGTSHVNWAALAWVPDRDLCAARPILPDTTTTNNGQGFVTVTDRGIDVSGIDNLPAVLALAANLIPQMAGEPAWGALPRQSVVIDAIHAAHAAVASTTP